MKEVTQLIAKKWIPFEEGLFNTPKNPGVYVIAIGKTLAGSPIQLNEIKYVGQTTSVGGLKSRLRQFKRGTESGKGHSCGNKLHPKGIRVHQLCVAWVELAANPEKATRLGKDLRTMGKVRALEYHVIAYLKEQLGKEPDWNVQ
ncbi:MAG: hypothetical protein KDB74_02670 [Flavobacteriales bacterium]|nr:hypothetical protein [Flavobacteriales bacterium]